MAGITPIYAAILAIIYLVLSFRVIGFRRSAKISLGDGENPAMRARVRVHANFAEYVPFVLLLMLMAEINGATAPRLHLIGGTLLIGRLLHAWGVSQHPQNFRARVGGMVLTFAALIAGALANLGIGSLLGLAAA